MEAITSCVDTLTFSTFLQSPSGRAGKPHAQRVWQDPLLHDHVAKRVAQRPLQLLTQLQGADVALLPDLEADVQLSV